MALINRQIEYHEDELGNKSYFMHGDKPIADVLVDEEDNAVYRSIGTNFLGEKIFTKTSLD